MFLDPIRVSEIVAYCDAACIDCINQRLRLIRIVQAVDAKYLNAANPQVK